MKKLVIREDANGVQTFSFPFSDYTVALVLDTAGTAESVSIPAGAKFVVFSATNDFYCTPDGTAVVPSADITDGSAAELNPTIRHIEDESTLSLVSPSAGTVVTLSFYS